MERGRFIVFEGIDGSGKSTALAKLTASYEAAGTPVEATREETDSFLGEAVRRSIVERLPAMATLHMFVADRLAHIPWIEEQLGLGRHVLCDRYQASTVAYQGVTLQQAGMDDPAGIIERAHEGVHLRPDLTLLFDLPVKVALGRIEARGKPTPYEKAHFLESVRAAYLAQVGPDWVVLDATLGPDELAEAAREAVDRAIGL